MQKYSDLFIQNIQNLPIWVKQVVLKEVITDLENKMKEFQELVTTDELLQYLVPKITFKGKEELDSKSLGLSDGYYRFLQDIVDANCNLFEITLKNSWTFADTVRILLRLQEIEYIVIPNFNTSKSIAIAKFISGKIKTGEFLKKIGKIDSIQLEQALRYQKQINEEGRHIKMASILIKMGFISNAGLDSLLLLKEESRRRLPINIGMYSIKQNLPQETQSQVERMQKEIARLENENSIMKKRLKKILNIEK